MLEKNLLRMKDITRLFDIGPDSIRYYEKVGLINPIRDKENNYRLYSLADVNRIMQIREMLQLGFSTDEIHIFLDNKTVENTGLLFEKELSTIDERMEALCKTRNSLKQRLMTIRKYAADPADETVRVLNLEERHCCMISDSNIPNEKVSFSAASYMKACQAKTKLIGACICYTLDLKNSNPDSDYFRTYNVFLLGTDEYDKSNYILPAGLYLSLIYRGTPVKTKQLMPKLYTYAEKNGFTDVGLPIEFGHIDRYETDIFEEFVIELELPVQRKI